MLRMYTQLLQRQPILTKAVTAGIVGATGDLSTQVFIDKHTLKDIDWHRTARFGGLGLFIAAPTLHVWYGWLSRTFPTSVAKRVACDQLGFAPVFLGGFIYANDFLEHRSHDKGMHKFHQEWVETVLVNWVVWVPFQALNFKFVPLHYQVLANNLAAVFWNSYLSWKLHKGPQFKTDLKHV